MVDSDYRLMDLNFTNSRKYQSRARSRDVQDVTPAGPVDIVFKETIGLADSESMSDGMEFTDTEEFLAEEKRESKIYKFVKNGWIVSGKCDFSNLSITDFQNKGIRSYVA